MRFHSAAKLVRGSILQRLVFVNKKAVQLNERIGSKFSRWNLRHTQSIFLSGD